MAALQPEEQGDWSTGSPPPDAKGNSAVSVVKLVAMNLLASGQLAEGVELLLMINKVAESCRFLQVSLYAQRIS